MTPLARKRLVLSVNAGGWRSLSNGLDQGRLEER